MPPSDRQQPEPAKTSRIVGDDGELLIAAPYRPSFRGQDLALRTMRQGILSLVVCGVTYWASRSVIGRTDNTLSSTLSSNLICMATGGLYIWLCGSLIAILRPWFAYLENPPEGEGFRATTWLCSCIALFVVCGVLLVTLYVLAAGGSLFPPGP